MIDRAWWSGALLAEFLDSAETEQSVGLYDPFLDGVVARSPALFAAIVLTIEVTAGVLLALNLRPKLALLIGAFLNVHFVLAGVVNPSAFYLILAFTSIQWRMERGLSLVESWRVARWSALGAVAVTALLVWSISTLHPDSAMEDPALVLIFLGVLFAFGAWWTHKRIVAKTLAMKDLGYYRRRSQQRPPGSPPQVSRRSVIEAIPSNGRPRPKLKSRLGGSR